ncbi:myo-inosose-2 dehydratase [Tropicimonas sp.]|uniref:myo-inosose-2 dehydratase n=1 Tax=Tropicimonas sp. TaxID=2067044 RepID=UPI003A87AF45
MPQFKNKALPDGVKLGVSPLSWTNEVLEDLGADITLETCLAEAAGAGFQGMELGRKFPRDPATLRKVLGEHGLELISGWYSGLLADRPVAEEQVAVAAHARLLADMGAAVMVYGETGSMFPHAPLDASMSKRVKLDPSDMRDYAARLDEFSRWLLGQYGLELAYHHHLMMVAETWDEISSLFDQAPSAGLLLDTGHAYAGGFDYFSMIERFASRINHIHLKDVRSDILERVRTQDLSFNASVRAGMFTVPGDGVIDFEPLRRFVSDSGYQGWMVVEAEQDPTVAIPAPTVRRAFDYVSGLFAASKPTA